MNIRKRNHFSSSSPKDRIKKNPILLYGIHTVKEALHNPQRKISWMMITRNALEKLAPSIEKRDLPPFEIKIVESKDISKITGKEATHQGVVMESFPLAESDLSVCANLNFVILLDQITDPRNIGSIIRSAVVFGAEAIINTTHHSASEGSVLAKAASGGMEHIHNITVKNLAETIKKLHKYGFYSIGLDSAATQHLEKSFSQDKIALVLGAEGKGLRQRTCATIHCMASLNHTRQIHSLNVSNAAAIGMYITRDYLNNQNKDTMETIGSKESDKE